MSELTTEILLKAYAAGIFPMAESGDDSSLFWVDPDKRGIIPLEAFHLPRRLRRTLRANLFEIRCDGDFAQTIRLCAAEAHDRSSTWINAEIVRLYSTLHEQGYAHSIECWKGDDLVGGLYGLALGGAFFGESMFSRQTDASKLALAHLVARLKEGGFKLLDVQFVTEHLKRFGAVEIPRQDYHRLLAAALKVRGEFPARLPKSVDSYF